jgi:capsular exopolysaccharide synthesis family protein
MLRTSLMYFNVDRDLDSVVITSAGEKEGKTTVATRLAVAAATSGRDVILVDADLRRAQVGSRFGFRAQEGLGSLIAGTCELSDVLVDEPVKDAPGSGRLQILPAGSPPPNPAALMSSPRMQQIVRQLESQSDLVILDTPAALAVSDALPLMRAVNGVVVVARMNSSSRQTIRRLQKIIESAHGNLLGVVATGAAAGLGYAHYYPKYYAHNGTNGHKRFRLIRNRRDDDVSVVSAPSDE